MEKVVSYCGIICGECPAYIATKEDDDTKRRDLAEQWSKQFDFEMKPEDINCDGCMSDSERKLGYCSTCEIRNCGMEKGLENCAYCNEYTCEKLDKFHEHNPKLREILDNIRETIK